MPEAIAEARWVAARAIMQGFEPNKVRIAAAMGLHATVVAKYLTTARDGVLDFRRADVRAVYAELRQLAALKDAEPEIELAFGSAEQEQQTPPVPDAQASNAPVERGVRLERLRDMFLGEADRLIARFARPGAAQAKAPVEAVNALIRLADKIELMGAAQAEREQEKSDEDIAADLARISDKIVELAVGLSKGLAEGGVGGGSRGDAYDLAEDGIQPEADGAGGKPLAADGAA